MTQYKISRALVMKCVN